MSLPNFVLKTIAFSVQVGKDIKELRSWIGNLPSLNTTAKSNLVVAINEVKSLVNNQSSANISSSNWYRVARNNTGDGRWGEGFILILQRNYMDTNNESYTFSINIVHGKAKIVQLSGYANHRLIEKIRVVPNYLNVPMSVDIYYNSNISNNITAIVYGSGTAMPIDVAPVVTGETEEISTVNGISVSDHGNSELWNQAYIESLKFVKDGGLYNASNSMANKAWFDYNWAGSNSQGSVISFSGLNSDCQTELFGSYYGNIFGVRTHNGDTNGWNPLRWLWHSGNFNPSSYATTNEINNIYDQLSAKANTRLSNLVSDLSAVEKTIIKTKLGISESDASNSISKVDIHISQDFQNILNNISNVGLEWGVSYRRGKTLGISIAIYNNSNNSIEILPHGTVGFNLMTLDSQILQRCNSNITELAPFLKLIHNDFLFNINNGATYLDFGDGRISHTGSLTVDRNSKLIITGELECLNI